MVIRHRAMRMTVAPRHDRHPGRSADRILTVRASEDCSRGRKLIQDRSESIGIALVSHGSKIVLVGHKEKNVWGAASDGPRLGRAAAGKVGTHCCNGRSTAGLLEKVPS